MGETIVYAIKIALAVAAGIAFFAAIITLFSFISTVFSNGILNETFHLISILLPFRPVGPLNVFLSFASGVLAFLGARKAYQLLSEMHKSS